MSVSRETKILEMKAPTVQENKISGIASGIGNLDRGNDVIFPGFFKKALKNFLQRGFIAQGHDWTGLPIAMPTIAREDGNSLYCEATFHSTAAAQDARTVCMERIAAGKSVGLSIGFAVENNGYAYFDNGKELLAFAKTQGYDLSLFDIKGITGCKTSCRGLLECADLFEWSHVNVPMNTAAAATEAKALGEKERAMPEIVIKGTYLGDIERTTACGVIRSVLNALASKIYSNLYATDASVTTPSDLLKDLPEACNEARDMLTKTLPSLVEDLDIEELREQSRSYYDYYYASPPGEHKTHTENEAALEKGAAFSITTVREFEAFLGDHGFSRKQRAAIALHGFNSLRDAGETETPPATQPELTADQTQAREFRIRQLKRKLERVRLAAS